MKSKWRKGIAGALAAALVLSQAWGPVPALAAVRRSIEEFEELPEEIQYQTVAYGTEKKALNLPKYLSALVASENEDREDQGNEDQGDKGEGGESQGDKIQGGESQGGEGQGDEAQDRQAVSQASPSQAEEKQSAPVSTGSEADRTGSADSSPEEDSGSRERDQEWKRVKVSWELEQSFSEQDVYDGQVPGLYVFEAKLSGDRYELGGAELPQITVEVLEEEEQGTPSEAGRKQRLVLDWTYLEAERLSADGGLTLYGAEYDIAEAASRLPARIQAEIEGGSDEEILDLIWECRDCAEELTAGENYRFEGKLPRGYSLAESAAEAAVWVTLNPAAELSLEEQARAMEQEMTAVSFRSARSNGAVADYSALSGRTFVIGGELVLQELAEKVNSGATWADGQISYADSSYILTDDIGLTGTWTPIGNEIHPFAGSFDGDGYTVDALRIRENAGEGAGLFGVVESGTVQNLGVTGAAVAGEGNVGVIAGTLRGGVIRRCFTSGSVTVSGEGGNAGGIAGCMEQDGSAAVENCHSKAQVNGVSGGLQKLGGIVGFVGAGQVVGCYSTGVIAGDKLAERFLGGVVGLADSGTAIRFCAALNLSVDNFTGAIANADRIVGVEGAGGSEAVLENNYAYEGIRTITGGSYWGGDGADTPAGESLSYTAERGFQPALDRLFTSQEGWETGRSQLPVLRGIRGQDKTVPDWITSGISTLRSLSSEADLKAFRDDVNAGRSYEGAAVRLTTDIDLTENWTPIGTYENPVKGTFDGEGHVIIGMKIDTPDESQCGFFGVIAGGTIKNLGLKNVDIKGYSDVGAVVGLSEEGGTINSCYSDGRIAAFHKVGGIIGGSSHAKIENCYSAVTVEVDESGGAGGGIAGLFVEDNIIKNCYSTGCLTGSTLGGLLGELGAASNTISNCAALNPSIAEVNRGGGYRVVNGSNTTGTRENNFAFSAMKIKGKTIKDIPDRQDGLVSLDGKDLTYNHTTQTFDTGWDAIFDGTEAWIIEPGRLPVLKGVGGQDGAMPQWITDSEAADLYIGNEAEFRAFRDRVNSSDDDIYDGIKDKRVVLTADILLTEEWEPIGAWAGNAFQGTFEGGGHVIRGMRQSRGGYCGLFGHVQGGAIRNLGLEDARLTGNNFIGAIAGEVVDGQIEGCYSRGSVVEGMIAGGLAGVMSGNSAVRNSYSTGVVRGELAAGLVGGQIDGLTGPSDSLTVENSYSIATVISEHDMAGGLVGGASQLQVRDSAALNVSLRESTGGSSLIHRIGGSAGDLTAENNWAFSDMPVNGKKAAGDDGTGLNGRDGAREAITGNAVLFPDSSWVRAQGCYPVLRAFAGQEPFSYADSLEEQAEKFAARGSGDSGDAYTGVLNGTWERLENGSWKFRLTGGGYAAYRWGLISGRWYYFDADGRMATGWLYLNDVWYCLATGEDAEQLPGIKEGDMITGWYYDRRLQRWFYLEANGAMAVGWKEIDGKWYYFNPVSDGTRGAMTVDAQVDGYALGADGAAL